MRIGFTIMILLLATAVAGCAATQQSTQIERSGFLGDYSLLSAGGAGEAAFRYVKGDANWRGYDKIMLDQVTVWQTDQSSDIPAEDMQRLANNLYGLMYQELEKDYAMVSEPQAGAIRVQIALTGADQSNPTLDVVSTVIPISFALSSAAQFVTGEPTFGGGSMVELKATDAATGEVLAAAIDRRVGGKDIGGSYDSWDDVNSAFAYWGQLSRFRLCELRGGTGCVEPG